MNGAIRSKEQGLPTISPTPSRAIGRGHFNGVHVPIPVLGGRVLQRKPLQPLHSRFCLGLGSDPWGGPERFWKAFNPLQPGLIRVEADELSYGLHIVLRYELELALLEQGLPVAELPERWNQRFGELLGQRPDSDSNGCLQDIHRAEGLFGYFPSYALGHLISAQLRGVAV